MLPKRLHLGCLQRNWASGHPHKDGHKDTRDEHLNHFLTTRTYENIPIRERDWTSGSFGKRDYFNAVWRSFSGRSSCLDISSCMDLHILHKSNGFHPLMACLFQVEKGFSFLEPHCEMPRNRGAYSRQDGPQFQLRSTSSNQDWQQAAMWDMWAMHLWILARFPHVLTAKSMVKRIPRFFQSPAVEMVWRKKIMLCFQNWVQQRSQMFKCTEKSS